MNGSISVYGKRICPLYTANVKKTIKYYYKPILIIYEKVVVVIFLMEGMRKNY